MSWALFLIILLSILLILSLTFIWALMQANKNDPFEFSDDELWRKDVERYGKPWVKRDES